MSTADRELLEIGIKFHGHKCPAMPLGLRVGLAALEALGVERDKNKELYCQVETGFAHATMCFVDGVQVSTGCTYGKANIEKLDLCKNAITLIDVRSGRRAFSPMILPLRSWIRWWSESGQRQLRRSSASARSLILTSRHPSLLLSGASAKSVARLFSLMACG